MGTAIVITSGKGGTGKTSLTAGLAGAIASMGLRVLCIDADVGLRNLDLTLGMSDLAVMDFTDVMAGRSTLEEAAAHHPTLENLHLLTAPVTAAPEDISRDGMKELIGEIKQHYDYCLIDAPAGIGAGFRLAAAGADRAIVVATTDATSLRDAQRTVWVLEEQLAPMDIHLVVNRVKPRLMKKLQTTIDDAMDAAGLPLLGLVPEDELVNLAGFRGQPLITLSRKGAATAYGNMAKRLQGDKVPLMRLK